MLQRYRLRLGDGTVLQVDREGLQAWVEDDRRAMVQIAGTSQWRPLREFLKEEESAARLARALVRPEPRRSPAPAPPVVAPPSPVFEPPVLAPPSPVFEPPVLAPPSPAFEPAELAPPPSPAFEPAELAPPPSPAFEAAVVARPPSPAFEPAVAAPSPTFEPAIGEPPVQALAEEPRAPIAPWQAPPEAPGGEAPAIRFKPLEDEPPTDVDEAEVVEEQTQDPYALPGPLAYAAARADMDEAAEPGMRLEGPLLQVVTAFGTLLSRLLDPLTPLVRDWPARSRAQRAPRAVARRAARPVVDTPPAPAPPAPPRAGEPPLAGEPHPGFELPPPPSRATTPPTAAPAPQVSVLAEDPGRSAESRAAREELPVSPLEPLDEAERASTRAWQAASEKVSEWVAGVSGWLAGVSGRLATAWAAWGLLAGLPARLQSLRERNLHPESAVPRIEPPQVVPRIEPPPRRAPSPAPRVPASPSPRAALRAPTPIAELPSIRLAPGWEAPDEGDVYEGEEETSSVLPIVWMWTKRLVIVGGLVAGLVLAALNWQTWFPRAAELGQSLFTEIDRQARSSERAQAREQAFANAAERCPHLAPATIRLVLSTSSEGVLEPPEVFQAATDAADRGIGALAPGEAAELRDLQHELVAHLRPPQRARLAEYERARATRVVFPFENPHALDLVARGARAMPGPRRARLQVLLGKAVAAGLGSPSPAPPTAPPGAGVVP